MPLNPGDLNDYSPERIQAFKQQALLNERYTISGQGNQLEIDRKDWAPRDWPDPQLPSITTEGASLGPLIAEGDSWFDYLPGIDILDHLRYRGYAFDVSYARAGDTLENMIYGTKHDRDYNRLPPTLDAVLTRLSQVKPKALLFSGGGNDVAGEEFTRYFNHSHSGLKAFRDSFAEFEIGIVFKKYLDDLCAKVRQASPSTVIVMHGYGHTPPTGKAVINAGDFRFIGPWLRNVLTSKGITDTQEQRSIVFYVIDLYNEMLKAVQRDNSDNFRFVDLRQVINPDSDWANELHLTNAAFYAAASRIHDELQLLAQ
ncbi:SGNH/GDSL hydrolase family protein [Cyanobium gracile]|uniref:SGNH hydrolase-type esterase domain-containing protein n=1 Tax=Cyanobium gracile (strain ATCC 27147 / PCC 6307) TaxID=292564 RepID=K9P8Z5_CYAGP|nr:SGNH/GDSL hydrolase family protein [Cyanobium gracile]AFY29049.1 hypothetical protein Cyagr_1917 [Cyanobium gracile PCC 6307]